MKNLKGSLKYGCLLPVGIIIVGLFVYFIGSTLLAPRFSALTGCDKGDGCLYTATNGNRSVRVIGYSPDGSRFLTDGSSDGIIHDATDGSKITNLDEGQGNYKYTISGDRSEIVAFRSEGIKFFNWDGELLRSWTPDNDDGVLDVAMVPLLDGFVIANKAGVSLWRMADGTLLTKLLEMGGILHIVTSADGEYVAAYDFVDDKVIVFPMKNLKNTVVIEDVDALSIYLSADGSKVAAGGSSGAYVWNTVNGALISTLEPDGLKVTATGLNDDGTLLGVGFENGAVTVFDISKDEMTAMFELKAQPAQIIFAPDNSSLAVGLNSEASVSGGELIFRQRLNEQTRPGRNLRTSQNRISVKPGYAIILSLAD